MTVDSLIAIFGLGLALFALIPQERVTDLRIRFSRLDLAVAVVVAIALHYLALYDIFAKVGATPRFRLANHGIRPEHAAYGLLFSLAVYMVIRSRTGKLPRRNVGRLRDLFARLVANNAPTVALDLLQRHQLPLVEYYKSASERTPESTPAAREILDTLLVNDTLVQTMAASRPLLAATLLRHDVPPIYGMSERLIFHSLRESGSLLRSELKNNQNLAGGQRYRFEERNRLLRALLCDAKVAEQRAYWIPALEAATVDLLQRANHPESDDYLRPDPRFPEVTRWESVVFLALRFQDIMVQEALAQGAEWHMGVYDTANLFGRLLANMSRIDKHELGDAPSEFPTPYHFLAYSIFSNLCGWVGAAKDLAKGAFHAQIHDAEPLHQNDNIPKSSVLALSFCVRDVVAASVEERLDARTARYLLDLVYGLYWNLICHPPMPVLAESLANVLVSPILALPKQYSQLMLDVLEENRDLPSDSEHRKRLKEKLRSCR